MHRERGLSCWRNLPAAPDNQRVNLTVVRRDLTLLNFFFITDITTFWLQRKTLARLGRATKKSLDKRFNPKEESF
jgi:hypothetical protein